MRINSYVCQKQRINFCFFPFCKFQGLKLFTNCFSGYDTVNCFSDQHFLKRIKKRERKERRKEGRKERGSKGRNKGEGGRKKERKKERHCTKRTRFLEQKAKKVSPSIIPHLIRSLMFVSREVKIQFNKHLQSSYNISDTMQDTPKWYQLKKLAVQIDMVQIEKFQGNQLCLESKHIRIEEKRNCPWFICFMDKYIIFLNFFWFLSKLEER